MSGTLALDAPAKVNLVLRVLHSRPDGYHELETVFQMVSLADRVVVTVGNGRAGATTVRSGAASESEPMAAEFVTLDVEGADLGPAEGNLAYLAAERFLTAAGLAERVHVRLSKRIPAGAGLGGGSSDAAAVLRCLMSLTETRDEGLLREVAAGLGSDVPFFLGPSPTALGRGRGEVVNPLAPLPAAHLVIAMPSVHVSTAEAYEALAEMRAGAGGVTTAGGATASHPGDESPDGPGGGPHGGPRPSAIFRGLDWRRAAELAENDFQPVVSRRHKEISTSLEGLLAEGATFSLLSGSGGAAFGVFADAAGAERAAVRLSRRLHWPFEAVQTLEELPTPSEPLGGG